LVHEDLGAGGFSLFAPQVLEGGAELGSLAGGLVRRDTAALELRLTDLGAEQRLVLGHAAVAAPELGEPPLESGQVLGQHLGDEASVRPGRCDLGADEAREALVVAVKPVELRNELLARLGLGTVETKHES